MRLKEIKEINSDAADLAQFAREDMGTFAFSFLHGINMDNNMIMDKIVKPAVLAIALR